MLSYRVISLALAATMLAPLTSADAQQTARVRADAALTDSMAVSTEWLAAHLKDPNVVVVDWEAASAGILHLLSGDGFHLRTQEAKQVYANLIFDAIGRPDLKK